MPRISLKCGDATSIALRQEQRVSWAELREICDEFTGYRLDPWELDKLTQWTEEHPAYQSLPDPETDDPEEPTTDTNNSKD